ncbi:hypothetical protein DYB30_009240 [Aphanomyces astaci]|uniref:Uncharacterized protein n=1 Tax=Aphanomyces astaci TaxID=112090 RepID=A0A397EQJ4_APHAT|nr:hypothetical protein DYB30_009240 [Aphanomyces astaci]RHZ02726.1 hypothetical protein DYB31_013813 [Aphanomyces astaci]RHZ24311.1 hypothetical protein DYB26_006446 [Aphanomyces astaci]
MPRKVTVHLHGTYKRVVETLRHESCECRVLNPLRYQPQQLALQLFSVPNLEFLVCKHLIRMFNIEHSINTLHAPKLKVRMYIPPFWVFPTSKLEYHEIEATKAADGRLGPTGEEYGAMAPTAISEDISIILDARDKARLTRSKDAAARIAECASWIIMHARDIEWNPKQLDGMTKLMAPVEHIEKTSFEASTNESAS